MVTRGQEFTLGGETYKVVSVSFGRAHCVSVQTRTVTVTDKKTGRSRTFTATSDHAIDISPDSPLELLKEI